MFFKNSLTRIGRSIAIVAIAISLFLGSAVPPGIAQDLPLPDPEFHGTIGETYLDSEADDSILLPPTEPPKGAPNVVLIMLDDVGFGASETFGGPVHTPTLNHLAHNGLRYNRFHTTAMCSPTRAALLTGRNHHSAASGIVTDFATGFPGYTGLIPQSTATVAQILQAHGYNTAWFGKNHNLPANEGTEVGPFTRWPNDLGFDYFYGFSGGGGETDQWYPSLYENRNPINQPSYPDKENLDDSYNLTRDLADKAISWVRYNHTLSPDKPFFLYFVPGATHAPHQPPPSYTKKYEGMFTEGWDELQKEICANQIEMGIIPADAKCTERPEEIPAWNDSQFNYENDEYRHLMALQMQNFAGFLEYADEQVGRTIEAIDELGELDNTLIIYLVGDNGASAEGSFYGSPCNQFATYTNLDYTMEENLDCQENIGNPGTAPHFAIGWAWATDAPFRWTKQVASYFGGTRNPMVVSWPKGIEDEAKGELRDQFLHVIDVAPTILDAIGINPPYQFNDILQKPIEGASFANTFKSDGADATPLRDTQYFELIAHRGIYHDGWMASSFNREPWINTGSDLEEGLKDNWELFDLDKDFSQHDDVSKLHPNKLKEMEELFDSEAKKYDVYPLDDRFNERAINGPPTVFENRTNFDFYPGAIFLSGEVAPNFGTTDYTITADLDISNPEKVQGVILANGGDASGFSLYVNQDHHLVFEYNYMNLVRSQVVSEEKLPQGKSKVAFVFDYDYDPGSYCFETTDGTLLKDLEQEDILALDPEEDIRVAGCGGEGYLYVNNEQVAEDRIEKTFASTFYDSFDVGMDLRTPVSEDYEPPFEFTGGEIEKVTIDIVPVDETDACSDACSE